MRTLVSVVCASVIFVATSAFAQNKDDSCVDAKIVVTNAVAKHVSNSGRQENCWGLSDKNKRNLKRVVLVAMVLYFSLKGILGGKKDSKGKI